ncbi:MAG: hypothetical protein GX133_01920 [Syntrophomonadaceae bacterium]|nr:hypothetical protein [Syntrophomonadaceae bacterium]
MSALKWRELVKCLKSIGFKGPFKQKGRPHPFYMTRGETKLRIPNVHGDAIGESLLSLLRSQGNISKEECKIA